MLIQNLEHRLAARRQQEVVATDIVAQRNGDEGNGVNARIRMPGRKTRETGTKNPCAPEVMSWGQEADKARALAAGFNHHFTKPVQPDQLSQLLRADTRIQ